MDTLILEVQQGKLCGVKKKNVNGKEFFAFRGIPYAKPPVGERRFKDPEATESWSGIREAKTYASKCAQVDILTLKALGTEDCLYLNVFTPNLNCKPVMVWIHGGGFYSGAGDDDFFGPDYLIEKDIVLVTINYRLGILGFLNLDDEEASGNQGLKDQVMALRWVQQNIGKFGGDPNNVTIFGESAGGASVHYLNLSPLARGLFHKSIIQSGVATNPYAFTVHSPKEAAIKISSILGKETTDTQELIKYLRTVDVIELAKAEHKIKSMKVFIIFKIHLIYMLFVFYILDKILIFAVGNSYV
ncbi:hypothetical protein G9C98_001245 [Cotesia typhae]|uniref:Carboxylic ester hydrolase n=1 Tax=Cotesia typhae TaxID=2053667 RepID=A0A8J5QXY9_9HYME|nr:hypothetical protein G9C98_001245 [Cotesia typhae]